MICKKKSQVKSFELSKHQHIKQPVCKPKEVKKCLFPVKNLFSVYYKYKNYSFLSKNEFLSNYVALKFFKLYGSDHNNLKKSFKRSYLSNFDFHSKSQKVTNRSNCGIIFVYVVLRQNNIFVTITQNNTRTLKIFSSGSLGIPKSDRKRSPAFFAVIKKTLYFLRPYIQASGKKKNLFRLVFKGFKRFRRPLINRFLFNKNFKSKCIGISNLDFEAFNGCRKPKAKRIKIKNRKKKNLI